MYFEVNWNKIDDEDYLSELLDGLIFEKYITSIDVEDKLIEKGYDKTLTNTEFNELVREINEKINGKVSDLDINEIYEDVEQI